ncbi:MAG TPA: hypothetical protein VH369_18460 [Bryobacteraceae bacterium]|jgi:hypothetical protein
MDSLEIVREMEESVVTASRQRLLLRCAGFKEWRLKPLIALQCEVAPAGHSERDWPIAYE